MPWICSSGQNRFSDIQAPKRLDAAALIPITLDLVMELICASVYTPCWILSSPGQSHVLCIFVYPVPTAYLKPELDEPGKEETSRLL